MIYRSMIAARPRIIDPDTKQTSSEQTSSEFDERFPLPTSNLEPRTRLLVCFELACYSVVTLL